MVTRRRPGEGEDYIRNSNILLPEEPHESDNDKSVQAKLLPPYVWLVILLVNYFVFVLVNALCSSMPTPKTLADNEQANNFIEERAIKHLKNIVSLGPRPVGSIANEVEVVDVILKTILSFQKKVKPPWTIEHDIQTSSGTFTLGFIGHFSSIYQNIKNIVVKISPTGNSSNCLLVNCHYDSVLDSPGASDDAITCALMLEVLDVLISNPPSITHCVIFLFNGAEENVLQASHGFITQHKWASKIRAFINLDAAGAGGKELLFQAGPGNPWLIQTYASVAPHPFASVFGQEVFESGLIPSDTDFRIFRDYGNLPGLDIAYIHNGYVYHTKYDNLDQIPPGCVQRGGDNLLALVKALASSPQLVEPAEGKHGSMVFFDLLGLGMIIYPQWMGVVINSAIVIATWVCLAHRMTCFRIKSIVTCMMVSLISCVAAIVTALILSLFLHHLCQQPLSWYSRSWLLVPLYVLPSALAIGVVHLLAKKCIFKDNVSALSLHSFMHDAQLLAMSFWLLGLTLIGINSAVVFLAWLLFPLASRQAGKYFLGEHLPRDSQLLYLLIHWLGQLIPLFLLYYVLYGVLDMFIPLMGRIGTELYPDTILAVALALHTIFGLHYQVMWVYATSGLNLFLRILAAVSVLFYVLVLCTPLGFPYSNEPSPKFQRFMVQHIVRTFHDANGAVENSDSMIWTIPFDAFSVMQLQKNSSYTKMKHLDEPYAGMPHFYPMIMMMQETFSLPASSVALYPKSYARVTSRKPLPNSLLNLTIAIDGPCHMNIFITPLSNCFLSDWSVGSGYPLSTPTPDNRDTYFILYSYASKPRTPYQLSLIIDTSRCETKEVVKFALTAHYIVEGESRWNDQLSTVVESMPDYSIPIGWSSAYTRYIF